MQCDIEVSDEKVWFRQGPNINFPIGRPGDNGIYVVDYVARQPRYILEQMAALDHARDPAHAPLTPLVVRCGTVAWHAWLRKFAPDKLTPKLCEQSERRKVEYDAAVAAAKNTVDSVLCQAARSQQQHQHKPKAEPVWSISKKLPALTGQKAIVVAALLKLQAATSQQLGDECARLGLVTRQPPEKVVYYYLKLWEKEGYVHAK